MDQSYTTSQTHQKRKVTKQDVFAEPTRDEDCGGDSDQVIPAALTEQDFGMYSSKSPNTSDASGVTSPNQPNVQVVGSFDEINDVLTPGQAKSLQRRSGQ